MNFSITKSMTSLRLLVRLVNSIISNLCSYLTFNMNKSKLPSNWIVLASKSHPDRIYYFNTKTNQSTWKEPTLEQANVEPSEPVRKRKRYDEEEECSRARTPEYNFDQNEMSDLRQLLSNKKSSKIMKKSSQEQSNQTNKNLAQQRMKKLRRYLEIEQKKKEDDRLLVTKKPSEKLLSILSVSSKRNETPQMKALREKMLQRKLEKAAVRHKPSRLIQECDLTSSYSPRSPEQTENNKSTVSSLKRPYSKLTEGNNISSSSKGMSSALSRSNKAVVSLDQNTDRFTPQMRALIEKRNSNTLAKSVLGGKQDLKITKTVKTPEKQENILNKRNANWNKHDVEQNQNNHTNKNLAQDRMQKLRKNLSFEIQKYGDDCLMVAEKSSVKLNKTVPITRNSGDIGLTGIHRNTDMRLKRLHNRILKETVYERNTTLRNNELQIQQSSKSNVKNDSNMTKEKIMEQAKEEVLYEEMDWEPMKVEEITLEVVDIRTQLNSGDCANMSNYPIENASVLNTQSLKPQERENSLFIVIDTNVFLSNLQIIEQARDVSFKAYQRPYIVIPWTVICELDRLKDSKSRSKALNAKARKAILFINKHFASKHPRILGQTRGQAMENKEKYSVDCPDDEILQCCLEIKNSEKIKCDVVLLSYDINLCNKAMIYRITTLGPDDPLKKLDDQNMHNINLSNDGQHSPLNEELRFSDEIFEDAKSIMKNVFSTIVTKQMEEIYGPQWEMFVIIKPPWTITTALKCVIKHWIAAINESFEQHVEFLVRELLESFERLPVGGRKLRDVECVLEKCSDLIQAINMDKYYQLATQSFNAITTLKKKCLKYITDIDRKKLHDKIGTEEDVQKQEQRAEKALQCFKKIYSYARDFCGSAASVRGKAFPINYNPINPPLSLSNVKRLQPDITKKMTDLSQIISKLLVQAENNSIKYQTLLILQQDLNAFSTYIETSAIEMEPLDIFCCVTLKEEILKVGLRQLQELSTHYRALGSTCT